jgi:hypothetical protein
MFVNDEIVFLQLDKTASTHIAKLLHSASPGTLRAKHSRLEQSAGDRCVIGSIRNPWDWYVSLWAYGCKSKGKVYRQLTQSFPRTGYRILKQNALHPGNWGTAAGKLVNHSRKDHTFWRRLYSNADDPALFREWLWAILSEDGKDLLFGKWEYPRLPLREFTGLLTYRFLSLFVEVGAWRQNASQIQSRSEMQTLYHENCNADRFIHMEQLEHDLNSIFQELNIDYEKSSFIRKNNTNASDRNDMVYYYDNEAVELINQQDQLIVSEFNYESPIFI